MKLSLYHHKTKYTECLFWSNSILWCWHTYLSSSHIAKASYKTPNWNSFL